jgi:GT2 family glycosyltransferase
MPQPEISICILAGHGVETLDACLESLGAQVSAPSFELLIGGNPTPEAVSVVRRHFPAAQVCDTGRRLPGAARNPLIERASGELLLFLDDDVTAPPELLRRLADTAARHPEASVFGGPNGTPPNSSRFQVVQGAVLSSLVGTGPVSRRYGARHPGFADERWFTLCNLAVRRRVMLPFLNELVCAEENELLSKLRSEGGTMLYEPRLWVFHARRGSLRSFARQMLKYGRGRGQLLAHRPGNVRAAYLAPVALLLYLVALATLAAVTGRDRPCDRARACPAWPVLRACDRDRV